MNFITPIFAFSVILPLIVLLYYFFRKKYEPTTVSSTLFWEEVMKETKVSPYFQKLQKNLLLFLQLLILFLLVFALMQPYFKRDVYAAEQLIVIFDTSASVSHDDLFEKHRKTLKDLVEQANGQEVTIIQTGHTPKAILQKEMDTKKIHQVINQLEMNYEHEHLPKALQVATAMLEQKPSVIHVFSDEVDRTILPMESEQIRYVVHGSRSEINNVSLRRFMLAREGESVIALAEIANETEKEQALKMNIKNEDGRVIQELDLVLEPQEVWNETITLPNVKEALATIEVDDQYQLDNQMYGFIEDRRSSIRVDSSLHPVLVKGLQAIYEDVKIGQNQTESMIVVTNDVKELEKEKPIFLFGRNDQELQEVTGEIMVTNDRLFTFSTFDEVFVKSVYPPIDGAKTIATIGETPFIQRTDKGDIIFLTELTETDLSIYPDFPLFLWSVIEQLGQDQSILGVYKPNDELVLPLESGDWDIYKGDSFIHTVSANESVQLPRELGKYEIRNDKEVKHFYLQLEMDEKYVKKGQSFELGVEQELTNRVQQSSIVPYIVLLILSLLIVEWEVQRRRGFSND